MEETGLPGENHRPISWWSALVVEIFGELWEYHAPTRSHWQTLSHNVVSSTSRLSGILTHATSVVIGTDWKGSCKSNFHTITTPTAPHKITPRHMNGNFCCHYLYLLHQYLQGFTQIYTCVMNLLSTTLYTKRFMYNKLMFRQWIICIFWKLFGCRGIMIISFIIIKYFIINFNK